MKTLWILTALLGASIADLPSCERAQCSHCDVKFIAKMCEKRCEACPRTISNVHLENRLKAHPENNRLPLSNHQGKRDPNELKQVKQQKALKKSQIDVNPRQAGVATQTMQQVNGDNMRYQQTYQNVQLAAPQTQVPAVQYPQAFANVATLSPIVSPPRPNEINSNFGQQPADLAQPLPEYNQNGQFRSGFAQQQQPASQFQTLPPLQVPFYNTNQNLFPQQGSAFGQPSYQSQPNLNIPQYNQQQQPTTPLLNPFQPFMQQAGATGTPSLLDPFGLFNFPGMTNPAQGTSLAQPQVPPFVVSPHTPKTVSFGATLPPPPPRKPSSKVTPRPYYGQQQQIYYEQQLNPNVQPYQGQQQLQGQPLQNVYTQQYNSYNPVQQPRNLQDNQQPVPQYQLNQAQPQQPVSQYQLNQAQPQQPHPQYQVANALPRPPSSSSIDGGPINIQKYVEGKGAVPPTPPQQCPRQPGWAPCITKEQANERFSRCCARLGDGCLPLCTYDAPLATMQLAVLSGRCPLSKMADIMVCASGYEDASACCEAYNVFEPGYEQCRPYCNPAAGLPQGGLLSEKYKCLVKLSQIQQCFYVSQKP